MARGVSESFENGLYRLKCILFGGRNKRGDLEIQELITMLIVVVVVVVMIIGVSYLLMGRGGQLLDSIKGLFRFGR